MKLTIFLSFFSVVRNVQMLTIVTSKQINQEVIALNIETGSLLLVLFDILSTKQKMKLSIKDFSSKSHIYLRNP